MPKVLIVTGDAAESLEVMYPYQRLTEEGYQVDIAAPSVKKLQFVVHDFIYRKAGLYPARRHRIRRRRPGRVRGPCHPEQPGSGVHPE
jgi:putative intracellular protease/amidase